jgi:hypothetical protein
MHRQAGGVSKDSAVVSVSFCSSPRKTIRIASCIGSFAIGLFSLLSAAAAQNFTPPEEIWRKSQIFNPKPSFDTTPVEVRVVSLVYSNTRKYHKYNCLL